jgi:hypothetical protein
MVWGCQLSDGKIAQTSTLNPAQSSTPTISSTTVRFLNRQGKEFAVGVESKATQKGVSLNPLGISALNQNIAFIYGLSTVGSILLRTEDGGKNWQEVMSSDPRSRVPYVVFANQSVGWALLEDSWGEVSGPITLYRTRDAGRTWMKLSDFPLYSIGWYLFDVRFLDIKRGQIDIYNAREEGGHCSPCLLNFTTSDGGLTWGLTNQMKFKDSTAGEAYQDTYSPLRFDRSIGLDGSSWQLVNETKYITVLRGFKGQAPAIVSTIPKQWGYNQGEIIPP